METPKSVYLAGPMTGIPEFNFPAFHAAAFDLRDRGIEVFSPAEKDLEDGFDPQKDKASPLAHYMQDDLPAVCRSDAVVCLPGWQRSKGARLETMVAHYLEIPVLTYPDLTPVRHPSSARFHALLQEAAALHDQKQADYGSDSDPFANVRASEDWGIASWVGALVRLNDKVQRLKAFARKGSLQNESAQDSMVDIAVYALIAHVLYDEQS